MAAELGAPAVRFKVSLPAPAQSPTLYPDAANPTAIALACGKTVLLVSGKGELLLTQDYAEPLATPVTVADIDADGAPELIFATVGGSVICINAKGESKWSVKESATGQFKSITAADVNPAPGLEVFTSFESGWLRCLSADGRTLWYFYGDRYRTGGGFAIGGTPPSIYYGTDNGHVYSVDGYGRVNWRYSEMAPYGRSGPNLADANADGQAELYITRSNIGNATCLMALDASAGKFLWRTQDVMQGYCGNATVDLDGDGKLEIIHGDKGNYLYCENSDGARRWQAELGGNGMFWAPCVADLDGDGHYEIIAGMRSADPASKACVFIVGDDGAVKSKLALGGGANASPAAGDFDGNGKLEVAVAVENPNELRVLSWNKPGKVAWASFRGTSAMTANGNVTIGDPVPAAATDSAGDGELSDIGAGLGENECTFKWKTPAANDDFVEIAIAGADGYRETRVIDVNAGDTEARLPFYLNTPDQSELTAVLHSKTAAVITKAVVTPAAANECGFEAIEGAYTGAVKSATTVGADYSLLQARWLALLSLRESVGNDPAAATKLRRDAQAIGQLATMLGSMWEARITDPFVSEVDTNPWDNYIATPEWDRLQAVEIQAFQNELEDTALTLMNVTGSSIDVRCTFNEPDMAGHAPKPEPELARRVTLRRAISVSTNQGDSVPDALPELDLSRSITLPPGDPRQLWLVVDTRGMDPGKYELPLYLTPVNAPASPRQVMIKLEVWPVALPDNVFDKINWSSFNKPEVSDQAVKDMIDHHLSVIYGPPLPKVPVNAKGLPAGAPDWAAFDDTLARVPKHFFMLWSGPPACDWPAAVPAENTAEYAAATKTAIAAMATHLAKKRFGWNQWAYYPVDEPWNTGFTTIPSFKRFCQRIKAAEPRAQIYADPTGLVRVKYVEEFKKLVDIWQPEINVLKRDPELAKWFRENSKRFWVYEAPGEAKHLLPLGHYRAQAWLAWKLGACGAGFWVYKGEDNWWPQSGGDYSVVYQTGREVVPSRRWEASRDGVEDYRALYVLRDAIAKARQNGNAKAADTAQALLDEAVQNVAGWQIGKIDEITRMTRDYETNFETLTQYRKKIQEQITKLR
jgi:hypothetical protein